MRWSSLTAPRGSAGCRVARLFREDMTDTRAGQHQHENEQQRHGDETAEIDVVTQEEILELQDEELAQYERRPDSERGKRLSQRRRGGPESMLDAVLDDDHHLEHQFQQRGGQERKGKRLGDYDRTYSAARFRITA